MVSGNIVQMLNHIDQISKERITTALHACLGLGRNIGPDPSNVSKNGTFVTFLSFPHYTFHCVDDNCYL